MIIGLTRAGRKPQRASSVTLDVCRASGLTLDPDGGHGRRVRLLDERLKPRPARPWRLSSSAASADGRVATVDHHQGRHGPGQADVEPRNPVTSSDSAATSRRVRAARRGRTRGPSPTAPARGRRVGRRTSVSSESMGPPPRQPANATIAASARPRRSRRGWHRRRSRRPSSASSASRGAATVPITGSSIAEGSARRPSGDDHGGGERRCDVRKESGGVRDDVARDAEALDQLVDGRRGLAEVGRGSAHARPTTVWWPGARSPSTVIDPVVPPTDRAQHHRRQVLGLVQDDVAEARAYASITSVASPTGQVGRATRTPRTRGAVRPGVLLLVVVQKTVGRSDEEREVSQQSQHQSLASRRRPEPDDVRLTGRLRATASGLDRRGSRLAASMRGRTSWASRWASIVRPAP